MFYVRDSISQNYILQQVIRMSLENAERFLNDATLLINNSSYGHAFALTILALEEIGKATYCNWAKNGFIRIDNDFLKRLKSHKTKQRVIKEIVKLAILKTEVDNHGKSKKRRKAPIASESELNYILTKLESSQFKSVETFYGELEKMKQLALYVDISEDGIPSDPNFVTKDACDKYLHFVKTISTYAQDGLNQN